MDALIPALLTLLGVCVGAIATLLTARLSTRGLRQLAAEAALQRKAKSRLAMLRELRMNQLILYRSRQDGLAVPLLTRAMTESMADESGESMAMPLARAITGTLVYNARIESTSSPGWIADAASHSRRTTALDETCDMLDHAVAYLEEAFHFEDIEREKQRHERAAAMQSLHPFKRWWRRATDRLDPRSR